MARTEARLKTAVWSNKEFVALEPLAQWVYFLILSQPTLNLCGVAPYTGRRWASRAKGLTVDDVEKQVAHLADARFVLVDLDTEEVWVRTFTKYDGVLNTPYLTVAMTRDFETVSSPTIREAFISGLGPGLLASLAKRFPAAWKKDEGLVMSLSEGFREQYLDTFPEPIPDHIGEPIPGNPSPNPSGNHSLARARRAEPPSALSLKPSDIQNQRACAQDDAGCGETLQDERKGTEKSKAGDPLVERWLTIVANPNHRRKAEAEQLIAFLRKHIDEARIDECIGACANESKGTPQESSYLLRTVRARCPDYGVDLPAYPPA